MFCFDPANPLLNAIVEIVAESPSLPVGDLHVRLTKEKKHPVTIQHLYRIINRLIEAQILLKEKGKLSLNRIWLAQLSVFANAAALHLEKDQVSSERLPRKNGQCVVMHAESLHSLQAMWYHTLAQLYAHAEHKEQEVVKYYAHAWWLLDESDAMRKFFESVAKRGIQCFWLLGSDTYLDRMVVKRLKPIFPICIAPKEIFPKEGYCVNVYGDYILECIFPKAISAQFALLFKSIVSKYDDAIDALHELCTVKTRYHMKVWKNKELAESIRAKVHQFF